MKIPFTLPYIGPEEIARVTETLQSGWLTKGPATVQFEQEFAAYVNSSHAVGLNSCTAGLHLAQIALGIGPGDEVITTPYTFVATANTILHTGAKPVFVDIDPISMNLDPALVEAAITPRTKAIIPVHFAGLPCDMDAIIALANKYRLYVIEDAAHAVHTNYKGRPVGSIGDITCFSFYATKNLATGEGGMATTDDESLAERMRVASLHGMSKNAWNRYSDKGSWHYDVEYAGFKYNMTDVQAALGLVQLQKLPAMQRRREQVVARYNAALASCDSLHLPYDDPRHRHAWHLYVIRLKPAMLAISRELFIAELGKAGIGTSVHFIPVPHHPYYRRLGYRPSDCPQASHAYAHAVSLPLYPGLSDAQADAVIDAVMAILAKNRK